MDQEDVTNVQQRLARALGKNRRIVFWEDPDSDYAGAVPDMSISGATIVDATGHELATKRRVLRTEPDGKFIIYRSGAIPAPAEDFLYDVKLAAEPFTCSMEGVWADECGVRSDLAPVLADHAAFFKNADRRRGLKTTKLSKSNRASLELAMTAAVLLVRDGERREVARRMAERVIFEHARGEEQSLNILRSSNLDGVLWNELRAELGYDWPIDGTPTSEDLALKVLEGTFGRLNSGGSRMSKGECDRIVNDLLSSNTRDSFQTLCHDMGHIALSCVPDDLKTVENLASIGSVPQVDEEILSSLASMATGSGLDPEKLGELVTQRRFMPWWDGYENYYYTLLALARLNRQLALYNADAPNHAEIGELFDAYKTSWWRVDEAYRHLILYWHKIPSYGTFHNAIAPAVNVASSSYDDYVTDVTNRWQSHLMDRGCWPPKGVVSQLTFFSDRVKLRAPEARDGHRVGVILSDALRYECGQGVAQKIASSKLSSLKKVHVEREASLALLPSYTQLGMAATLPDGKLEIDPDTQTVTRSGMSTQGTVARQAQLEAVFPGSVAVQAKDVLEKGKVEGIEGAPVIYVFHNKIDATGDHRDTESTVFSAVETAEEEIEELTSILIAGGCERVIITSDHGFLYQDHDPDSSQMADVPGLSIPEAVAGHTRRFAVGSSLPTSEYLVEWEASKLSLSGDYQVALAKGTMRLRVKGSGARYVHGGASPQEDVVPVITVTRAKGGNVAHHSDVQGYPIGRKAITGSTVAIDVYQCEPVSDGVTPVTIKVGVYAKDGTLVSSEEKTLTLASTSTSSDDRKTRIVLSLTGDVDQYSSVTVRVSTKVGDTNSYRTAWEQDYTVSRAFGSDF